MTTITTFVPATVAVPRGAPVAARLFGALLRAFQQVGAARAVNAARAARVRQAAATRRYALRHMAQNPRFAEDLLAAAERHERGL
jgi:hypothetical protein